MYPGDPRWTTVALGQTSAAITATRPRLGNGSLEFQLAGNPTDWAYYLAPAGDRASSSFGSLDALDRVGFDWLRADVGVAGGDVPWLAQSPVLRLLVREDLAGGASHFSELVWERYYNDGSATPLDQWQSEDLVSQRFWRVDIDGTTRTYTRANCATGPIDPLFPLLTLTPQDWAASGCYDPRTTFVWAIGVGIGSNWPHPYVGFVDNVQLGFGGSPLAVGANFELAPAPSSVPEPTALWLVASGLTAAGLAHLRTRRRRASASADT